MPESLRYKCDECGARYNGRKAAIMCCSQKPDDGPDGHLVDWKDALGGDALA